MSTFYKNTILLFCFLCGSSSLHADPGFETRRTSYINTSLANLNNDALAIQAYKGLPLDVTRLNNILNSIATNVTSDLKKL